MVLRSDTKRGGARNKLQQIEMEAWNGEGADPTVRDQREIHVIRDVENNLSLLMPSQAVLMID